MNKKGYYAAMMLIMVIIAMVMLNSQIRNKVQVLNRYIGDAEEPLLKINNDVKYYDAYLKEAGKISLKRTTELVAANPSLQGLPQATAMAVKYCTQINLDNPKELRPIILEKGIKETFNAEMNSYLTDYQKKTGYTIPKDNFEFYAEQGRFTINAVKPTTIPIKDYAGKEIGKAGYKPAITIEYNHEFEKYTEIHQTLTIIAQQCSYKEEPLECAKGIAPKWQIEPAKEDIYQFDIPMAGITTCYYLSLPKTIHPST